MILQRLAEHYDRLAASGDEENQLAPAGFSMQKISFCIVLEPNGQLIHIKSLQQQSGKRLIPDEISVPGNTKSSGTGFNPCFLWDRSRYILGYTPDDTNPSRTLQSFEAFREQHLALQAQISHPDFDAVCIFLKSWDPAQSLNIEPTLASLSTHGGVFQIAGKSRYVHEVIPTPRNFSKDKKPKKGGKKDSTGSKTGQCLITGTEEAIAKLHKPEIKGIRGTLPGGVPLVSMNSPSAWSYGKAQAENAPVGELASSKYTKALNALLRRPDRTVSLGDSTVVFWADHPNILEYSVCGIFSDIPLENSPVFKEDPERLHQAKLLLDQLRQGTQATQVVDDREFTKFFLLGLSPISLKDAGRISVSLWVEADAAELQLRLGRHLQDIGLDDRREVRLLTLNRIVEATGRATSDKLDKKFEKVTKAVAGKLAGDLARSVLMGAAYPQSLLTTMLRRIRSDGEVAYARVAAIKGCLARNSRLRGYPLEVYPMLDTNNTDPAYCCGRAFALLERIQESSADGELNRTIKDSYFSSASATPALVFPRLCRLSQHHLAKLNVGTRIYYEKPLGEVLGKLNVFPRHLSIEDQGKFVLGYFHQRQDLFTSKKDKADIPEGANQ